MTEKEIKNLLCSIKYKDISVFCMEERITTNIKNTICIKIKNKIVKLEQNILIYNIIIAIIAIIFGWITAILSGIETMDILKLVGYFTGFMFIFLVSACFIILKKQLNIKALYNILYELEYFETKV